MKLNVVAVIPILPHLWRLRVSVLILPTNLPSLFKLFNGHSNWYGQVSHKTSSFFGSVIKLHYNCFPWKVFASWCLVSQRRSVSTAFWELRAALIIASAIHRKMIILFESVRDLYVFKLPQGVARLSVCRGTVIIKSRCRLAYCHSITGRQRGYDTWYKRK